MNQQKTQSFYFITGYNKMFNTDNYQSHPDFYIQACDYVKINTNKRYRFFRQIHFTAGDYEQFLEYWDTTNSSIRPPLAFKVKHSLHPNCRLKLYKDLNAGNVFNTFEYIFHKFKKGIFLKLVDGKPSVFLPFSKVDYRNEWYPSIRINTKRYPNIIEMMKYIASLENREFMESRVHKDIRSWYGNNGLVRLEYPISEGDNGVNMIRDMFVTLIHERDLPPCEIFINKRDFPILKKNGTEAYEAFFGNSPLRSFHFSKYAPILSMTTTDEHADIPIPTWEDWCRVAYWKDKKLFAKEFKTYPTPEEFLQIPWESKKETAVFRGASTGLGTTCDNNPRLFFSLLSSYNKKDDDDIPFLDVGITKWNLRPRKIPSSPYLETLHIKDFPFQLVPPLSPLEQSQYKYILHLPGHSEAYRLSLELFSGSVVLLYPCKYKLWFSHLLVPYVHYVPVDSFLPEDIYEKIRWCKKNDEQCKNIAHQAFQFASTYLSREAILDYLHDTLWVLYRQTGMIVHPKNTLKNIIHAREWDFIRKQEAYEKSIFEQMGGIRKWLDYLVQKNMCQTISPRLMYIILRNYFFSSEEENVKANKVWLVHLAGRPLIKKLITDHSIHEVAISYMEINHLALCIPNFNFTYLHIEQNSDIYAISDYIAGSTLEEMINTDCSLQRLLNMIRMICLVLQTAQNRCGFMHNDLYPWNIIIRKIDAPIKIWYQLDKDKSMEITTNEFPVLIDYGRSHIVHQGLHYYNVSPFRISSVQDVISIFFSCMYVFLSRYKLSGLEVKTVLGIMQFFISTYMPKHCVSSITSCKLFLKDKKKYSNMLMDEKTGLEHINPLDFYTFLSKFVDSDNPWTVYYPIQSHNVPLTPSHLSFMPFIFNDIVVQTTVLEALPLIKDISIIKDVEIYIRAILININNHLKHTESTSALQCLRIRILQNALNTILPFADRDSKMCIQQILRITNAHVTGKKIMIPSDTSIQKIPLLLSHPIEFLYDQKLHIHYNDQDWLDMYILMLMDQIASNGFLVFTRCFRNFSIMSWMHDLNHPK